MADSGITEVVTATSSSVRSVADALRDAGRRYGIRFRLRDRLEDGYANDVFRVQAQDGPLVLRVVQRVRRERPLESGVVHGDLFPGNVLVSRGRIAGLVDWEEAHRGWVTAELASGVWEFCNRGDELDRIRVPEFVEAYRAAGGTASPQDDDLLVPLIRVKRILEVLRAPTDRHIDWEYQLHNLRAFRNLG